MTKDDRWTESKEWEVIVENVPIVSVDLVVRYEGGILLGLRENEPAKGEWFVPGGTVFKNERRTEAVHRVAQMELGCDIEINKKLGTFEQFYETSELDGVESKHYLATAFVVNPREEIERGDDQHSQLQVFTPPFGDMQPYVEQYLAKLNFEGE